MSVQLPEALVLKALVGAFWYREDHRKKMNERSKRWNEEAGLKPGDLRYNSSRCPDECPTCEGGIVASECVVDSRVRVDQVDDEEPYLRLIIPLECARCQSEFEVEVTLNFHIEDIEHVGVADVDPPGAGDVRVTHDWEIHDHFDGTGNWSR